MAAHAHIRDDLEAYAITAWAAHIAAEQEAILVELLRYREAPDNLAFIRQFGLPDVDLELSGRVEEDDVCSED